jgi:hypothetical protein
MTENGDEATQLHDLDLQQKQVFKQALIPCSTTQLFQQRANTFSNHSHNQIKDQHTDVFRWQNPYEETSTAPTNVATWSSLLMQRKRLQRDFTREFLTIDHRQMTLHAL